jgi:hypothetical protein
LKNTFENRNYSAKFNKRYSLPSLDTAINAAEEPWTETETKINDWLKPMATKPYSRAFQNKTGLQADLKWYVDDYYKKKDIDYTSRKPALETLKNGTNKPQFMNSNNTKPVIIFDVNETLLDMAPLKNNINSLLEEPQAFRIWYGTALFSGGELYRSIP